MTLLEMNVIQGGNGKSPINLGFQWEKHLKIVDFALPCLITGGYTDLYNVYISIYTHIYICEQFDPCSGLSLLIVVPVVLVMQGNVTAWHSENGLFPHA